MRRIAGPLPGGGTTRRVRSTVVRAVPTLSIDHLSPAVGQRPAAAAPRTGARGEPAALGVLCGGAAARQVIAATLQHNRGTKGHCSVTVNDMAENQFTAHRPC